MKNATYPGEILIKNNQIASKSKYFLKYKMNSDFNTEARNLKRIYKQYFKTTIKIKTSRHTLVK